MKVFYIGNFDPFETVGTRRAYEIVRRAHRYGVESYVIHAKRVLGDSLTKICALRSLKEAAVMGGSIEEAGRLNVGFVVSTSEL